MHFQARSMSAAIIFTVLSLGVVGLFVVLPIACIQWTWNTLATATSYLPLIEGWQAMLLYLAMAVLLYLSGVVHIEFETEKLD